MKQAPLSRQAEELRSKGRGEDSMLVHMTPGEVGGLQQLALASGGSLTVNPETGLPEAGWLGKLLPTLLGVAGAAFGLPTWAIGLGGLAGGTAASGGDLSKGIMAGLGAMGGAGLGNAAGLGGSIMGGGGAAAGAIPGAVPGAVPGATAGVGAGGAGAAGVTMGGAPLNAATGAAQQMGGEIARQTGVASMGQLGMPAAGSFAAPAAAAGPTSFFGKYAADTSLGMGGLPGKILPMATGYAALSPLLEPNYGKIGDEEDPWGAEDIPEYGPRTLNPRVDPRYPRGEINYFDNNPAVRLHEGGGVPAQSGFGQFANQSGIGTMGSGNGNGLAGYVSMFNQQNPGAVQSSLGYPGGSATDQLQGQLQSQSMSAPPSSSETNYGFQQPAAAGTGGSSFPDSTGSNVLASLIRNMRGGSGPLGQAGGFPQQQGGPAAMTLPMQQQQQSSMPQAPMLPPQAPMAQAPMAQPPVGRFDMIQGGQMQGGPEQVAPMYSGMGQGRRGAYAAGNDFMAFARGGEVHMESGGFVMPARETAEFGNGSTEAGFERLMAMGGMPIRGQGDGVSDSVPAMIDGRHAAAVANGETYFPPAAVKSLGGAEKLRSMMNAATQSRKRAARGDTHAIRGT